MEEKLELFNYFSDREKEVVKKHIPVLALVPYDELQDTLEFLNSEGIKINRAKEVTVLANPVKVLKSKIDFMKGAHENELYTIHPIALNQPAPEIYKRIQYLIQKHIPYRTSDSDLSLYQPYVFDEALFSEVIDTYNHNNDEEKDKEDNFTDTLIIEEPVTMVPEEVDEVEDKEDDFEVEHFTDHFTFGDEPSEEETLDVDIQKEETPFVTPFGDVDEVNNKEINNPEENIEKNNDTLEEQVPVVSMDEYLGDPVEPEKDEQNQNNFDDIEGDLSDLRKRIADLETYRKELAASKDYLNNYDNLEESEGRGKGMAA